VKDSTEICFRRNIRSILHYSILAKTNAITLAQTKSSVSYCPIN